MGIGIPNQSLTCGELNGLGMLYLVDSDWVFVD